MRMISYIIDLTPIPWKRAQKCGNRYFDGQIHEKSLIGLQLQKQHKNAEPFSGPISVDLSFFMPTSPDSRRQNYFYHAYTPDIDNLIKFILDTATDAEIIADDRLICVLNARKIYDAHPRTELTITQIEDRKQRFSISRGSRKKTE